MPVSIFFSSIDVLLFGKSVLKVVFHRVRNFGVYFFAPDDVSMFLFILLFLFLFFILIYRIVFFFVDLFAQLLSGLDLLKFEDIFLHSPFVVCFCFLDLLVLLFEKYLKLFLLLELVFLFIHFCQDFVWYDFYFSFLFKTWSWWYRNVNLNIARSIMDLNLRQKLPKVLSYFLLHLLLRFLRIPH